MRKSGHITCFLAKNRLFQKIFKNFFTPSFLTFYDTHFELLGQNPIDETEVTRLPETENT